MNMRFYKDRYGRTRLITPRGVSYESFRNAQMEDAARRKVVIAQDKKQLESKISVRFRNLLWNLAPDKIELNFDGQMVFLKAGAHFTWDLAKRRLEKDLTDAQKLKFLKEHHRVGHSPLHSTYGRNWRHQP